MFSTHSMKYIWYSPQKSKYPLCICTHFTKILILHFLIFIFLFICCFFFHIIRSKINSCDFQQSSRRLSFQDLIDTYGETNGEVAYHCNERPSQTTANPVGGKACSSTKGGLLRYIVNTYSIHKVSNF